MKDISGFIWGFIWMLLSGYVAFSAWFSGKRYKKVIDLWNSRSNFLGKDIKGEYLDNILGIRGITRWTMRIFATICFFISLLGMILSI